MRRSWSAGLSQLRSRLEVASRLREAIPTVAFALDTSFKFHREKKYEPKWDVGVDDAPFEVIEDAMVEPAAKILARCYGPVLHFR